MVVNRFVILMIVLLASIRFAGCREKTPAPSPAATGPKGENQMKAIKLTSPAFQPGEPIPQKYTGEGDDVSPPLKWSDPPKGTQEFALIVDDPDAPSPQPWVHWIMSGIAPDTLELPEGVKSSGSGQGTNSFPSGAKTGYRGPMPPPGHGPHHYYFRLYALDTKLNLPPSATKDKLLSVMNGHVLGEGEIIGTYERKK
jgi:Raf kinase inhibitor-like YbhB/YbcL family protein